MIAGSRANNQMFQTSAQITVQASSRRRELAIATGIFYFAASLGGAIGQAQHIS